YYQSNDFVQDTLHSLILLGRSQRSSGDYRTALKTFRGLVETAETSRDGLGLAEAYEGQGTVLLAQEQFPQALESFQKGLESSPTPQVAAVARLSAGYTLTLLGRDGEATAMWGGVEAESEKLPSLKLYLELRQAGMALSWGRYPVARRLAEAVLA